MEEIPLRSELVKRRDLSLEMGRDVNLLVLPRKTVSIEGSVYIQIAVDREDENL